MKHKDTKYKINHTFGLLSEEAHNAERFMTVRGIVQTKYGIVSVYSIRGKGKGKMYNRSHMDIIVNGNDMRRSFGRSFTRIGLARKATEFAKEMHEKYNH